MFKKIRRYTKDPYYSIGYTMLEYCPHLMSDKFYLKCFWKLVMKYELDLDNPQTFNEKLQWLKLYDRKPEYTQLVDKYEVKRYVAKLIGEEYIIPSLGVFKSFDEINFDKLPRQFVLKCTHDSGGVVICKDKRKLNIETSRKRLSVALAKNFYYEAREWPYKNVEPRILAENYIENMNGDLFDYKVFCFNGHPGYIMYLSDRNTKGLKMSFFDREWNLMPFRYNYPSHDSKIDRPKQLDKILELSAILSKGIPHVRVDFYCLEDGSVKFGEMTFTSYGGMCSWEPKEWNAILGKMIHLPPKN